MLGFGSINRTIELFKGSIEPPNLIELSSSTKLELERFDLSLMGRIGILKGKSPCNDFDWIIC